MFLGVTALVCVDYIHQCAILQRVREVKRLNRYPGHTMLPLYFDTVGFYVAVGLLRSFLAVRVGPSVPLCVTSVTTCTAGRPPARVSQLFGDQTLSCHRYMLKYCVAPLPDPTFLSLLPGPSLHIHWWCNLFDVYPRESRG